MRFLSFALFSFLAAAAAIAQAPDDAPSHIKRLGSSDFRQRQAATAALKADAGYLPALRQAILSPDVEVARRAADIVDYHERAPLRELAAAARDGRAQSFVAKLAEWSDGKYEAEAWGIARAFAGEVARLHKAGGGEPPYLHWLHHAQSPVVISQPAVRKGQDNPPATGERQFFFVRARTVDALPRPGAKAEGIFWPGGIFVSSGTTRAIAKEDMACVYLANGDVEIMGTLSNGIIVSAGDVSFTRCNLVANSIVVARGKVDCAGAAVVGCRLIGGASVAYQRGRSEKCIISENDSNPLGFIRWADAPNDKDAPKAKAKDAGKGP